MPRPFRFALIVRRPRDGAALVRRARRAEDLGYDTVLVTDHLGDQWAPLPLLAAVAAATTTLRIGTFVLANDYRHPVMVAKEAATLDVLSGGRFELGLGAGWSTPDYRALGLRYDAPRVRIDRFEEAIGIVRRVWTGERVEHRGRHYAVDGEVGPTPVQRPGPPLMIGGGGPRVLRIAAREASIVAFSPQVNARGRPRFGSAGETALAERVAIVRAAAGERFADLDLNLIVFDAAVVRGAAPVARLKAAGAALLATPYLLYGTPDAVRRRLIERRERLGINYYALPGHAMDEFAPLVAELRGR
ncbi:MAG TPA: TIGR03621 family F420-dependent LLM class oxidoreductase [Candidatus Limnocylindria bacterium]|nr:TIGR03621 family F420-dependent LLM class oxidoreductase [Candidatus Limnocylindria bacterium]